MSRATFLLSSNACNYRLLSAHSFNRTYCHSVCTSYIIFFDQAYLPISFHSIVSETAWMLMYELKEFCPAWSARVRRNWDWLIHVFSSLRCTSHRVRLHLVQSSCFRPAPNSRGPDWTLVAAAVAARGVLVCNRVRQ